MHASVFRILSEVYIVTDWELKQWAITAGRWKSWLGWESWRACLYVIVFSQKKKKKQQVQKCMRWSSAYEHVYHIFQSKRSGEYNSLSQIIWMREQKGRQLHSLLWEFWEKRERERQAADNIISKMMKWLIFVHLCED